MARTVPPFLRGRKGSKYKNTPDTIRSEDSIEVILGVGEGENFGLADGAKSFRIGGTALINSNDEANFGQFVLREYTGVANAPVIFPVLGGLGSPTPANVSNLAKNTPVVRTGGLTQIDYIDLRFVVNQLVRSDDKGVYTDTMQIKVEYRQSVPANQPWNLAWGNAILPPGYNEDTSNPGGNTYTGNPATWFGGGDGVVTFKGDDIIVLSDLLMPAIRDALGIVWANPSDGGRPYVPVGGVWTPVGTDQGDSWSYTTGGSEPTVTTFYKNLYQSPPENPEIGAVWTPPGGTPQRFNGTSWVAPLLGSAANAGYTQPMRGAQPGILTITEKITSQTVREVRVPVERVDVPYDIRVTKISDDSTPDGKRVSAVGWESFEEIIAEGRSFPNTHIIHLVGTASDQFNSLPELEGDVKGRIIDVPTNYDPVTRTYAGVWDGLFKKAWTDNGAWCTRDFIKDDRYGLSTLYPLEVKEASFYAWAQWCDTPVPDNKGGSRPRWTYNDSLDQPRQAKEQANYMAGASGGRLIDDGSGVYDVLIDKDEPISMVFGPENVVDGDFVYSFSDVQTRANWIKVGFLNPDLEWEIDYRLVKASDFPDSPFANHIEEYGRIPMEFVATGKTNVSEALAAARLRLITGITEYTAVTFRTNRIGRYLWPFKNIGIVDPDMGWGVSGRISEKVGAREVRLRDPIFLEAGISYKFVFNRPTVPMTTATMIVAPGQTGSLTFVNFTTDLPADLPEFAQFSLESYNATTGEPIGLAKAFRILTITPADGDSEIVEITAMEVNRNKTSFVDGTGALLPVEEYTNFDGPVTRPLNVRITPTTATAGGLTRRNLQVEWDRPVNPFARNTLIEYSRDGNAFNQIAESRSEFYELEDIVSGTHAIRLTHVSDDGQRKSQPVLVVHEVTSDYRDIPAVAGLVMADEASPLIFETISPMFRWEHGAEDPNFKTYRVRVYTSLDTLKRTEDVAIKEFIYEFDKNKLDFGGTPSRTFRIAVTKVDDFGNESPETSLLVSNPVPDAPSITLVTTIDGLGVQLSAPTNRDVVGAKVWVSTTPDINTNVAAAAAEGDQQSFSISRPSAGMVYVRAAYYDAFGKTNLLPSIEKTTRTSSELDAIKEIFRADYGFGADLIAAEASAATAAASAAASDLARGASVAAAANSAAAQALSEAARNDAQVARTAASAAASLADSARVDAQAANTAAWTARDTAVAKALEASGSAGTAAGHASTAISQADIATGQASAASASALVATSKAGDALGSANASATSASGAATSATAAGVSASAANESRLAAQTAQSGAEIARNESVSAKNDAQGSASSAATQASLSATSAYNAGQTLLAQGRLNLLSRYDFQQGASSAAGVLDTPTNTGSWGAIVNRDGNYRWASFTPNNFNSGTTYTVFAVVYAEAAGDFYYDIQGASGTIITSPAVSLSAGQQVVLTWTVTPSSQPTSLRMIATPGSANAFFFDPKVEAGPNVSAYTPSPRDAQGYANAALTSAQVATSQATAAGSSATAAQTSRLAAEAANTASGNSAAAALTSSQAASSSASAAGSSASAAEAERIAAQTAKGAAESARDASAASATTAAGSASSAQSSETNAANSANAAGGSASAASGFASAASTSASDAATSASSALASEVSATATFVQTLPGTFERNGAYFTLQGNVFNDPSPLPPGNASFGFDNVSSGRGTIFYSNAIYFEISARGSVALKPGRSHRVETNGRITVNGPNPHRWVAGFRVFNGTGAFLGDHWTKFSEVVTTADDWVNTGGDPGSVVTTEQIRAGHNGNPAYPTAVYIRPCVLGGWSTAGVSGAAWWIDSLRYADVTEGVAAAGSATAAVNAASTATSKATEAGTFASAADSSRVAAETAKGQAQTSASNAATSESNAAGSASSASTASSTSASARDEAIGARDAALGYRDGAGGHASAASSSASEASASKSAAGSSASAANTSANDAATDRAMAGTHASNAAASASGAAGYSAAAQSSAGIAARVGLGTLNAYPTFGLYDDARDSSSGFYVGLPNGWAGWSDVRDQHRVPGRFSDWAFWQHNNAGGVATECGIVQDYQTTPALSSMGLGWYVLEADIRLEAGQIGGAGLLLYMTGGGSSATIDFAVDIPVGYDAPLTQGFATPGTYSFRKLVQVASLGAANDAVFHVMTDWSGFSPEARRPKILIWDRADVRPATDMEVAARRADVNASQALANVASEASTRASEVAALASRASTTEARAAIRPNLFVGFEGGVPAGASGAGSLATASTVWGSELRVFGTGNGVGAISFAPIDTYANVAMTITGDSLLFASSAGYCYFDLIALNAAGETIDESPQGFVYGQHDYSNDTTRRDAHAQTWVTPPGTTRVVPRFVWEGSGISALGCRNIKVEYGSGWTAYTSDKAQQTLAARTSITESSVADAQSKLAVARLVLIAEATGGRPARMGLYSDSYGASAIALDAAKIYFGDNTIFDDATDTLQTITGSIRRVIAWGSPFGPDGLFEWVGDSSIGLSSMSRANAQFFMAASSPYIGGAAITPAVETGFVIGGTASPLQTSINATSVGVSAAVTGATGTVFYRWSQISGDPCTISNPDNVNTTITVPNNTGNVVQLQCVISDDLKTRVKYQRVVFRSNI